MKVLLVGREFDFSFGDGISRYSHELYKQLQSRVTVKTAALGRLPRPVRAFLPVDTKDCDVVHLMYPDAVKVQKKKAKMVTMWHDLRLFTKYFEIEHSRQKPKLMERYGIANKFFIQKWAVENYHNSDAVIANCTKTLEEVKTHFKAKGMYDESKIYKAIPLGLPQEFLNAKVWSGRRRDFVYVGDIHLRHKNLDGLLKAFGAIAEHSKDAKLHIFTSSPESKQLLGEKLKKLESVPKARVALHYHAPDRLVRGYVQKAVASLHLSLEEGFGIPILESLALGTPVIILKNSSIPEEAARYATKVKQSRVPEEALRLAADPAPAPKAAITYARSFTWRKTADETVKVYKEALS